MQGFSWASSPSEMGNLPLSFSENGPVGPVAPRLVAVLSWEASLAWRVAPLMAWRHEPQTTCTWVLLGATLVRVS